MSNDFSVEQLTRLAGGGLQRSIAADVWPNGAVLRCDYCGETVTPTSEECGRYLAKGWPKHCGETMKMERACQ